MRPYSKHQFVEESEMLQNTMKSFEASLELFAICTYGRVNMYRLNDKATRVLI